MVERAGRSRRRRGLLLTAFAVLTATTYAFVEPYLLRARHLELRLADTPPDSPSITIVFASDIHHGPYFSLGRVRKLVRTVNELGPDVVLLGGDFVHRDARFIDPVFEELAHLRAPYGVYGVGGNHDHWEGYERTRRAAERAGVKWLDNDFADFQVGTLTVHLGGVGDLWEDVQDVDRAMSGTTPGALAILLSHNPDFFHERTIANLDLGLSGHTHAGQCSLFGLWAPLVPSAYGNTYRYGVQRLKTGWLYVTSGVGTITPPVRFFARPEIVSIRVVPDRALRESVLHAIDP